MNKESSFFIEDANSIEITKEHLNNVFPDTIALYDFIDYETTWGISILGDLLLINTHFIKNTIDTLESEQSSISKIVLTLFHEAAHFIRMRYSNSGNINYSSPLFKGMKEMGKLLEYAINVIYY